MKKKLFTLIVCISIMPIVKSQDNVKLFDQPIKLRNVMINIRSDAFVATAFIEIEFYNPNDKEVEGLYRFQLDPGQAITGFQLELNGKYRDGSIEERWKARSAYGSIVGKRMDPALLQCDYNNRYRLNIFPVPAKGTRKITMTIQQLLSAGKEDLVYKFPFYNRDTAAHFELNIRLNNIYSTPVIKRGLLAGKIFNYSPGNGNLNWTAENLLLYPEISFAIPLPGNQNIYCVKSAEKKNHYALRLTSQAPGEFDIHPGKLVIFWDVSASAIKRNIKKEINFLQQYISYYGISQLTIVPFNYKILDTAVFYTANNFNSHWEQYLRSLNYDGATQLGCLDFSGVNADVIFLVSDGKNSYGRSMPNAGAALIYCINSLADGNLPHLRDIAGSNGGNCIDLNKLSITEAIIQCGKAQDWLLSIKSSRGKITCDQIFPMPVEKNILLTGILSNLNDTITLSYGHGNLISKTENIYDWEKSQCDTSTIEKINMLQNFAVIQNGYYWNDALEFGLKEKVVTTNSSYIVLENAGDYIKYNIAPPKDLEAECQKLNYVKRDTRTERQKLIEQDEFDIVSKVVDSYNKKIKTWDKNAEPIHLDRRQYEISNMTATQESEMKGISQNQLASKAAGLIMGAPGSSGNLSEVVVVGYGVALKQNLTGSVSYIRSNQLIPGSSIEQNIAGRVAGVMVQSSQDNRTTQSPVIIRGMSSFGNNAPLYIIDGMPVRDNPNDYINANDIESITVLKDAASTAIYGGNAGNGVIVINSKRPRAYSYPNYSNKSYRLKDMEDVEYMQELKSAPLTGKLILYDQLRMIYGNEAGFYFDVAQYFFETGLKIDAMPILLNAAEASDGNVFVLKAIGYTLENWKQFDEAVKVYEELLKSNPSDICTIRDLAWAYYQNGNYQEAVNLLYSGIKLNFLEEESSYRLLKAALLHDMNAIITMQKDKLDISKILPALIRPLPVDLKIVIEGNRNDVRDLTIIEPGGSKCSSTKPVSKNGGMIDVPYWQYYYTTPFEYRIKNAVKGNYKIQVGYSDYYQYRGRIPSFIRIMSLKNFGKCDQSIDIENVIMDNQYGTIEIGEVKWDK